MRKFIYILLIPMLTMFIGCSNDEDYAPAKFEYVGVSSARLPSSVFEGGAQANEVVVPLIFGNNYAPLRDIEVQIEIDASSTAILGADFEIEGVSGQTFTVTIPADTAVASFTILTMPNFNTEDDRTVVFNIVSASDGVRPGYPFDSTFELMIVDDDCPYDFQKFVGEASVMEPAYGPYPVITTEISPNIIETDNFWDAGLVVRFEISPCDGSVSVPKQEMAYGSYPDFSVEGTGVWDEDTGEISIDVSIAIPSADFETDETHVYTFN